jgi:hypothetical protein
MYKIPEEFYYRLHHIRPRFKNDVESVLFFMAQRINLISEKPTPDFKLALNDAIRLYPNNFSKKQKTIDNWRTEISALFGLVQSVGDYSKPSLISELLYTNEDLIEFFRYFLLRFQYPGGHLKPNQILEMIKKKVSFHPAKYLIQVLEEGNSRFPNDKLFGLTKSEATHCIFNDLRVTAYGRSPKETVDLILSNRKNSIQYNSDGDVVRYAGDILDYMVLADIVRLSPNYHYYLNTHQFETLKAFIDKTELFNAYKNLYDKSDITLEDIKPTMSVWFDFVNQDLSLNLFKADISSLLKTDEDSSLPTVSSSLLDLLNKIRTDSQTKGMLKTKEIGDFGEAIVLEHEKNRMVTFDRRDLLHLIVKIPEAFGAGYDIKSFEGLTDQLRHIEVKTTVSRGKLATTSFHMTPNEWRAASTYSETYFIYRLLVSSGEIKLFVMKNPVGLYKSSLIEMFPKNGADIRYNEHSGSWEDLLA